MLVDPDQAQCTKASRELQQLVGQVDGVGSGSAPRERDGTGRRRRVEQTARQLQEDVGDNVPCAARMHVPGSSEGRESSESGNHAMGRKKERT